MVIKFFTLFFAVCSIFAAPNGSAESEVPTIYLRTGQRYPLEGISAENAKATPESVAKAYKTPEGILIQAISPGTATLTMTCSGKDIVIKVTVRDGNPRPGTAGASASNTAQNLLMEIKSLPGIHFADLGGKLVAQGEILGRPAYQKTLLAAKSYPNQFLLMAHPGPGISESLVEQANTLLINRGLTGTQISNAGNRYFLEGSVNSPEEVEVALETVQPVLPNIENHVPIPLRVQPTIMMRVYILELTRQAHQALGLSWPTGTQQAAVFTPQSALFNPIWTVSLQHLSGNGQARILAEPMLAVKIGSNAELRAGGEIPIRISGKFENKVVWKSYGLSVKISLPGIAGKFLRTRIETESSQLDEATAVDGVPGIRTNTMNTEIDALIGKPILLTGLFQTSSAKDVDKLPVLGSIPLLGELFKSRRFRDHESELLVALLPDFGAVEAKIPLKSLQGLEFDKNWRILD